MNTNILVLVRRKLLCTKYVPNMIVSDIPNSAKLISVVEQCEAYTIKQRLAIKFGLGPDIFQTTTWRATTKTMANLMN